MNQLKAKVKAGLSAGSALVTAGALMGQAGKDHETVAATGTVMQQDSPRLSIGPEAQEATSTLRVTLRYDAPIEKWTHKEQRRLKTLALKRAMGEATDEENAEFARLQSARRIAENPHAGDDMLSEWGRRRMIGELLEVLTRNVRFFRTEDQARIRSLRETHGE
jgi:hypothetical protein